MMFDQLSWAAGLASVIEHEAPVHYQSASLFIANEQNPTSRCFLKPPDHSRHGRKIILALPDCRWPVSAARGGSEYWDI